MPADWLPLPVNMLRVKHWVEWCAASGSQAAALSRVDVRTHDICVQFVRHNHDPTFSLACLDAATAYPGPPCPLRACCRLPLTTARHRDGTRFALCPRSFPLGGGIVIRAPQQLALSKRGRRYIQTCDYQRRARSRFVSWRTFLARY